MQVADKDPSLWDEHERLCQLAAVQYNKYLDSHAGTFSDAVFRLCKSCLHDAVIVGCESLYRDVKMVLDLQTTPLRSAKWMQLVFGEVSSICGAEQGLSDTVLDSEVYRYEDGTYELCLLCVSTEISICFRQLTLQLINKR